MHYLLTLETATHMMHHHYYQGTAVLSKQRNYDKSCFCYYPFDYCYDEYSYMIYPWPSTADRKTATTCHRYYVVLLLIVL